MADQVRALYYPDFFVDERTLAKEILLFDELHFMDRPSISFQTGKASFGSIGGDSPLRQFEHSFREGAGIPFYVHKPYSGPVPGDWLKQVHADLADPEYLKAFVAGLNDSPAFRRFMIGMGNYGEIGNQDGVYRAYASVNIDELYRQKGGPLAVFNDDPVRHMDFSSEIGKAKSLLGTAAICSAKMNAALDMGASEGFVPLADAKPYGSLLSRKYRRATQSDPARLIPITDLSFAVLDELLPRERLEKMQIKDAVEYRKRSNDARRAFMEHINTLQKRQGEIAPGKDYTAEVARIVETEIRPAARDYQNELKKIDDALFGDIAKGLVGAAGGGSVIQLFGDLSLGNMLMLAGGAAAYATTAAIGGIVSKRAATRECSLSYILALD